MQCPIPMSNVQCAKSNLQKSAPIPPTLPQPTRPAPTKKTPAWLPRAAIGIRLQARSEPRISRIQFRELHLFGYRRRHLAVHWLPPLLLQLLLLLLRLLPLLHLLVGTGHHKAPAAGQRSDIFATTVPRQFCVSFTSLWDILADPGATAATT